MVAQHHTTFPFACVRYKNVALAPRPSCPHYPAAPNPFQKALSPCPLHPPTFLLRRSGGREGMRTVAATDHLPPMPPPPSVVVVTVPPLGRALPPPPPPLYQKPIPCKSPSLPSCCGCVGRVLRTLTMPLMFMFQLHRSHHFLNSEGVEQGSTIE